MLLDELTMKRKKMPYLTTKTLLVSALAGIALSGCKTQSTTSQSPSSMPASKPPTSSPSAPSSSTSSGSSGGQQTPSASSQGNPSTAGSPGSRSPSTSPAGANQGSRPSEPSQSSSSPGSDGNTGSQEQGGGSSSSSTTQTVLDSPYYEAYDPATDTETDAQAQVDGAGTSPSGRSEQSEVSFEEGQSGGGQSSAERQASLEAELEGSFGRYDGMILRERDKVLAEGASRGAQDQLEQNPPGFDGGTGQGDGQGDNPYGAPKTQAGGQQQGNGQRNQGDGQGPSTTPGGRGAAGAPSGNNLPVVPDDIPDGRDDDIVARQIREAAIAEKDPKLREKLWEEYRKYKQR